MLHHHPISNPFRKIFNPPTKLSQFSFLDIFDKKSSSNSIPSNPIIPSTYTPSPSLLTSKDIKMSYTIFLVFSLFWFGLLQLALVAATILLPSWLPLSGCDLVTSLIGTILAILLAITAPILLHALALVALAIGVQRSWGLWCAACRLVGLFLRSLSSGSSAAGPSISSSSGVSSAAGSAAASSSGLFGCPPVPSSGGRLPFAPAPIFCSGCAAGPRYVAVPVPAAPSVPSVPSVPSDPEPSPRRQRDEFGRRLFSWEEMKEERELRKALQKENDKLVSLLLFSMIC